jgi:uncharacterized membrane protein (UPF0127 family)
MIKKKFINIINQTNPTLTPILAEYCQSFFCQLRGLMFRKDLPDNYGLLLVQNSESRINSSIHMMFMRMDLAVIWINNDCLVVDQVLARRWKLAYLPKTAARYVLETDVSRLADYQIGDKVRFEDIQQDQNA